MFSVKRKRCFVGDLVTSKVTPVPKHHTLKTYRVKEVKLTILIMSSLDGGGGHFHAVAPLSLGKEQTGNFSLHRSIQTGFWGPPSLPSNGCQRLFTSE
jgi:hypothetical protein